MRRGGSQVDAEMALMATMEKELRRQYAKKQRAEACITFIEASGVGQRQPRYENFQRNEPPEGFYGGFPDQQEEAMIQSPPSSPELSERARKSPGKKPRF